MKTYLIQEEYKEYVTGIRVVQVEAESIQNVLDGEYDNADIVEEIYADGETYETNMIDDKQFLVGNWKELVRECDINGVPLEDKNEN